MSLNSQGPAFQERASENLCLALVQAQLELLLLCTMLNPAGDGYRNWRTCVRGPWTMLVVLVGKVC